MTATRLSRRRLEPALANKSEANYPTILDGFVRKGIPAADIRPRENVFTYAAWRRKGRQVMKGEHGVKIPTVIDVEKTVDPETRRRRESAEVAHGDRLPRVADQAARRAGTRGAPAAAGVAR